MIHVLLVGGARLSREAVADLLRQNGFGVTALPASSDELDAELGHADVVVLDAGGDNVVATVARMAETAKVPIVAFGLPTDTDELVIPFAEAGVTGFVARESDVDDLVAGIEAAAQGDAWCPPPFARTLLDWVTSHAPARVPTKDSSKLTSRELEIVELIGAGLTNKEIATRLTISEATVKNHVHNILDKLDVRKRAEAAARLRLVQAAPFARAEEDRSSARSGAA